jgi:hypothetical protein
VGGETHVRQTVIDQMYAKLYAQVVLSSLTQNEPIEVRGVFFMLLAMADKGGNVAGVDAALARVINVPLGVFSMAVERLMQPDPTSQSPDYEGRRLIRLEDAPGYFIVNYAKYAGIANDTQRREYFRTKKQESRARQASEASGAGGASASEGGGEGQDSGEGIKTRPTGNRPMNLAQVKVACEMEAMPEERYPGLAEEFFNHYEGRARAGVNGGKTWVAGDVVITDWRAILRGWRTRRDNKRAEEAANPGRSVLPRRKQLEVDREHGGGGELRSSTIITHSASPTPNPSAT